MTETVKIVYEVDSSQLKSTQEELKNTGKITEELSNEYDRLAKSTNKAASAQGNLSGNADALKQQASAAGQAASGADRLAKSTKELGKGTSSAKKELTSLVNTLADLRRKYGEGSPQEKAFLQRAGLIKNEIKDLNRQIGLLNPSGKIQAFNAFSQGVFSAMSIATGSVQLFGIESEVLDRVIFRLSGVTSAIYGLTSFVQLKDQFKDLAVVLGIGAGASKGAGALKEFADAGKEVASTSAKVAGSTTETAKTIKAYSDATKAVKEEVTNAAKATAAKTGAQIKDAAATNTATAATVAQDGATKAATASTIAFGRALLTSPLFLVAVAIGAVVGALALYESSQETAKKKEEGAKNAKDNLKNSQDALNQSIDEYLVLTGQKKQVDVDIANLEKQRKASADELLKNSNALLLMEDYKLGEQRLKDKTAWYNRMNDEDKKRFKKQFDDFKAAEEKRMQPYKDVVQGLEDINRKFFFDKAALEKKEADRVKEEEDRKKQEAIQRAQEEAQKKLQAQEDYVSRLMEKLEEEKRVRQDALTLRQTQGDTQENIIKQQIENNRLELQSLQNIKEKARGTRQYSGIVSRINSLAREELNLRAQIAKISFEDELKGIEKRQQEREYEIQLLQTLGTKQSKLLEQRIAANVAQVGELTTLKLLTTNASAREEIEVKINELLKARGLLQAELPGVKKTEADTALDELVATIQSEKELELLRNENRAKSKQELAEKNLDTEIKYLEREIAERKKSGKNTEKLEEELLAFKKKKRKEDLDSLEQTEEEKRQKIDFALSSTSELITGISDFQNQLYENEAAELEKQKEKNLLTEEEYERRLAVIKTRQAEAQKRAQLAQAVISAAQGVVNALTIQPASLIPFAVALATTLGAFNVAKIASTPIPKFKEGTLSVPGIDKGDDSVYAMLRPGEAVIPVETKKKYYPALKAIYKNQIKPSDINAFVLNKLSGKNSIGRDTKISNSFDTSEITRALGKKRSVDVANADYLAKAIAYELTKTYNPRRA